jgi:phospholipid/cholesterol/gamma-HCH transport system substrate-binding protein
MNTDARVGTFVIGAFVLLGLAVYYVGNEQWGHHTTPYKTYLKYAGGIGPGADVLFGGINVGRVNAVRAWDHDPTYIEILLDVKERTPLNQKSVAKLGSVSLMSSPAVSITTGSHDAPLLQAGQTIPSQETVSLDDMTQKLSGIADNGGELIMQVQGDLKQISARTDVLLSNLNDLTGPVNRQQVTGILSQANALIAAQSPRIDRITAQIESLSHDADDVVKKTGPLLDHADGVVANVNSTVDQVRDPVKEDLAALRSTMDQAKNLMTGLQMLVRSNDDNIRGALENIRIATENLDQLTDETKQRPWSLIRIRQPPDRKVPK